MPRVRSHLMVSVADLLRWKAPPALIMVVLLLQFTRPLQQPSQIGPGLDFCEIFAGQAEVSQALRRVARFGLRGLFSVNHFADRSLLCSW